MGFLNNPWVIGIGGGILSGAIVGVKYSRIPRAEARTRNICRRSPVPNRDVIYAIRPGISEGQIPTKEVLTALVHATARRFGITPSDMYGSHEIVEELIKEVMDSSFLPSARKAEYCHELMPLQVPAPPRDLRLEIKSSENDAWVPLARHIGANAEPAHQHLSSGLLTARW